jgi:type II secretory pathway pseudopilin PulG
MKVVFHKDRREGGYVLLVLLLSVSLLSISLLAMMGRLEIQIKRDREKELIHRGLEYSRAVRKYVKMFGRYPNSVEQLENSNNIRFLRKRYKDPITGKDFNLLHYGDLETFNASGASVSATSGASPKPRILIAEDHCGSGARGTPAGGGYQHTGCAGQQSDQQLTDRIEPGLAAGRSRLLWHERRYGRYCNYWGCEFQQE